MEQERTLTGHTAGVWALLSAGGRLISGSVDHTIMVWDVTSGLCERILEGHSGWVSSLAASAGRLISGSWDETVRVSRIEGKVWTWQCERRLHGGSRVRSLMAWDGKVAGGLEDGHIRAWEVDTGVMDHVLRGHMGSVGALVVSGRRLFSSSLDKTIKGVCYVLSGDLGLYTICGGIPSESIQYIHCLTLNGSTLVRG